MRSTIILLAVLLITTATDPVAAQGTAIMKVAGRGVEGRPTYRGGGIVEFSEVSLDAQVVHFEPEKGVSLPLAVEYNVIEPAPILLTSRMGTEHWQLYDFATEGMSAMYADQKIDLSKPGKHTARATRAWFGRNYGPLPEPGLVGIRGHRYLLIDQADGQWLDVADPPAFFNDSRMLRDLTFTLADLTEYEIAVAEMQSTWESGGPLRVRVVVRDGQGRTLPVVGAAIVATADGWQARLATEWTPLGEPTGWMRGVLADTVPERLTISGEVCLQTQDGPKADQVAADFSRGTGLVSQDQFKIGEQGYELPRDEGGTIRETRAIWVSPSNIATADDVDQVVTRCRQARMNVIIPDIFVRNAFYAKSNLLPITGSVEEGFDPLGDLIAKAHRAGLEVHPWCCVT